MQFLTFLCSRSYVSLNERSRSIGAAAKQQAVTNYRNTVVGFKRALGRPFSDPFVQREKNRFFRPNVLEENENGNVAFRVSLCLTLFEKLWPIGIVGIED